MRLRNVPKLVRLIQLRLDRDEDPLPVVAKLVRILGGKTRRLCSDDKHMEHTELRVLFVSVRVVRMVYPDELGDLAGAVHIAVDGHRVEWHWMPSVPNIHRKWMHVRRYGRLWM